MRMVENFTELNKIKLNQLFKYINNHILQAIHSKKHFYCFDSKKNIICNLYTVSSCGCSAACLKPLGEKLWYIRIIYSYNWEWEYKDKIAMFIQDCQEIALRKVKLSSK